MHFLLILSILIFFNDSYARIIRAQSGSREHIQAAVNNARTGDTVMVPEGNFVFNGGVNVNAGITIMGAGRDRTTLRRTTSSSSWLFTVNCANGERFVMTGFTIEGLGNRTSRGVRLINDCKDFRIYDNTFRRCNLRAIQVHGNARGVIDNNRFIDNHSVAVCVYGDGDASWNRPLALGSENAVFVEDNYFEQRNVPDPDRTMHIASNNGSRYVFRHNRIVDGNLGSVAVDAHGNKFYWPRGSRSYEIYNNTFTLGHRWVCVFIRGGDGVIFGNTITGSVVNSIHLMHESRSGDGNCRYPCVDQIRQLHIWDNTFNGRPADVFVRHPSIIRLNRDYFLHKKTDYIPYTYPHPLRESQNTSVERLAGSKSSQIQEFKINSAVLRDGMGRISYTLTPKVMQDNSLVRFNVYSIQGRLVETFTKSHTGAGTFSTEIKNRNNSMSTGIYKIEMVVGNRRAVKQMVNIK